MDQPSEEPMRYSIFSVQDHYPDGPRDVPTLYAEVLGQGELARVPEHAVQLLDEPGQQFAPSSESNLEMELLVSFGHVG